MDRRYMQIALDEAKRAGGKGEVPVGAVVVDRSGRVLGRAGNSPISLNDPTGHAEILAMRAAAEAVGNYRLTDCTLYVTLEPCVMCAGAILHGRVRRLVYGANDPKGGAIESCYRIGCDNRLNHTVEITAGVMADEAAKLLQDFFRERRKKGAPDSHEDGA